MKAPATIRTVRHAGKTVRYAVQVSRSAKKMRIRVTPEGVTVVGPRTFDPVKTDAFVRSNLQWVKSQQAAVARLQVRRPQVAAGEMLLRGQPCRIVAETLPTLRRVNVVLRDSAIRVQMPVSDEREAATHVRRWLREQARAEILAVVGRRCQEMHRRYRRVYLRSQRTKWGNCSALRNLSFNWRLIMVPPEVLDYIVVHELAHLAELRHTARF